MSCSLARVTVSAVSGEERLEPVELAGAGDTVTTSELVIAPHSLQYGTYKLVSDAVCVAWNIELYLHTVSKSDV